MPQLELTLVVVCVLITLCLTLVCMVLCLMNGPLEEFGEFEDEIVRVDGDKIDTLPSSPQNDCFSITLDNIYEQYPAL